MTSCSCSCCALQRATRPAAHVGAGERREEREHADSTKNGLSFERRAVLFGPKKDGGWYLVGSYRVHSCPATPTTYFHAAPPAASGSSFVTFEVGSCVCSYLREKAMSLSLKLWTSPFGRITLSVLSAKRISLRPSVKCRST